MGKATTFEQVNLRQSAQVHALRGGILDVMDIHLSEQDQERSAAFEKVEEILRRLAYAVNYVKSRQ